MCKRITLLIALTLPALSNAAVYQCQVDGQTVFSDRPCGDNAKEIEIRAPERSGSGPMVNESAREFLDHRDQKQRVYRIDREIERLEDRKASARQSMDQALNRYQEQKARANNNLAGATWEGALAEEAEVLRQRYQSEIDELDREIDRLREERRRVLDQD